MDANPDGKVNLLGYSWGGGDALELANKLGDNGYSLNSLITFDPYKTFGKSYGLKHNNVRFSLNFYQQDRKSWITGMNPFRGVSVPQALMNVNLTNQVSSVYQREYNHIMFVRQTVSDYDRKIRNAINN